MISNLQKYSSAATRPLLEEALRLAALKYPLKSSEKPVDISTFMGKWYVLANIPMSLEVGASNAIENYKYNEKTQEIDVLFEYVPKGSKKPEEKSKSEMKAKIVNAPVNSFWSLNPKVLGLFLPLNLSYLVVDVADDQSYALIGR